MQTDSDKQKKSEFNKKSKNFQKTHLYFNDKYVRRIPKFYNFTNLTVLYLHNNEIAVIENLENLPTLSILYLQNNKIREIKNLKLKNLKKLYLGQNLLSIVENLDNLPKLEELNVEKQHQTIGNTFCFDPRIATKISETLRILNISDNKIPSISSLLPLKRLVILNAANNSLDDLDEICQFLSNCLYLRELIFTGNPVTKQRLYQENIVATTPCLKLLDGKEITDQTRVFFKKFHQQRVSNNLRKPINLVQKFPNLPKNYPVALQKAASASILKETKLDVDETSDEMNFVAWKALPKPKTISTVALNFRNQSKIAYKKDEKRSQRCKISFNDQIVQFIYNKF